jgi:hypothetical protein
MGHQFSSQDSQLDGLVSWSLQPDGLENIKRSRVRDRFYIGSEYRYAWSLSGLSLQSGGQLLWAEAVLRSIQQFLFLLPRIIPFN